MAIRLGLALVLSGLVSLVFVIAGLGLRPDMPFAVFAAMLWIKLGYTAALALVGACAIERLARPLGATGHRVAWGLVPLVFIVLFSMWQMTTAPPASRATLVMGASAVSCPWLIIATAAPMFAALIWVLRGLAPTQLALAGLFAGFTAGAAGAMLYALHCPEMGAPFVAVWYTMGIAAAGLVGWLTGPRLLRW